MTILKTTSIALIGALGLTGCATMPNFVPAHDQGVEEAAAARLDCKAVSEGMTPPTPGGFVAASGRPAYVGAVMGAAAIGMIAAAAERQHEKIDTYTDCMVAHGFRVAAK